MRRLTPSLLHNQRGNNAGQIGGLVGAVAGLAVAYFFPPAAGYSFAYFAALASVGSAVGGAAGALYESANADGTINKQETIADLRIQTSTLGQTQPQFFGNAGRVAGNIIWATEKQVHEHRETQSQGGKGGGGAQTVTVTKTYTISLAIALCDTRVSGPVPYILRAWKNANLLFDIPNGIANPNENWTFYPGEADQDPDPTIEAVEGVGNVPGWPYRCYLVMTDEELGPSGQLPQWSFELSQYPPGAPENNLNTIIVQLCNAAGLSGAALDVAALPTAQASLTLTSIEAVRASLEQLALAYDFYGLETSLTYAWRATGTGSIVGTIPEADGSTGDERATEAGAQLDRAAPLELPTVQYFTYIDAAQNHQRNTQPSAVVLPPSGTENPKNISTPLVLSADQARRRSTQLVSLAWVQREPYADVLPRKYCYLEPGDRVNLEARGITYPVVLNSLSYGTPGLVEVAGRVNGSPRLGTIATGDTTPIDGNVHDSPTIPPGNVTPPGEQTPAAPGDTTAILLNLPVLDSSDQAPRYHVAYVGDTEPWEGGVLYRSVDGEATYQAIDAGALEAITGTVALAVDPPADWEALDAVSVFTVVLEYGTLTTLNAAANEAGLQRVMVGDEMLYVGTATLTGVLTYDCSDLWRGRQGTEWATDTHGTNEVFVLLDTAIHKLGMTTAERGVSFDYKPVTRGQSIADVTSFAFTPTGENLIPWQAADVVASRPVQTWQIRCRVRARFVPGGFDPDWVGFRIIIYADNTFTTIKRTINTSGGYAMDATVLKGYDYLPSEQGTDFGSVQGTLYYTVAQVGTAAVGRSTNQTSTDTTTTQGAIEPVNTPNDLAEVYVTATTVALAVNTRYILDNASLVTATLPATAELFDVIELVGKGAGLFRVAQNANQKIFAGGKVTTTGVTGYLQVNHAKDAVTLECIVAGASTEWAVVSFA